MISTAFDTIFGFIKGLFAKNSRTKKEASKVSEQEYFTAARSWHDDIFTRVILSRNRYKAAFLVAMALSIFLVFAIVRMLPLQKIELVVAHQNPDGYTWLSTTAPAEKFSHTQAQTESEIAHYIWLRESYDSTSYVVQGQLVKYFSSEAVEKAYLDYQHDPAAPVNKLKRDFTRSVIIQSINFLSSDQIPQGVKQGTNVALVSFETVDASLSTDVATKTSYQAMISWTWEGAPADLEAKWQNYDGFTITHYEVTPMTTDN